MKYIQVGELGKAVLVGNKDALPKPGILFLNKFYVASNTGIIYTCKVENDVYSWKVVTVLPTLANGIAAPTQLREGVEAIDGYGNKVTGTMKFVEKTVNTNGTYYPADDNAQGYSKFIVDVAGSTAENPYIATTEEEMRAYLAEEYAGSFVRFENARYRNITLPYLVSAPTVLNIFDTALAQGRINKYIDYWTIGNNNRKIFSSNGRQNITYEALSTYQDVWHNIYAYKYKNSDGSYCRALIATVHILPKGDTNPDYTAFLLYIDGYIANDTVFPNYPDDYEGSTLTATVDTVDENAILFNGLYQEGNPSFTDIAPDYGAKPGYETMSWSITLAKGNNGAVTYLYSDAAVIMYYLFQQNGSPNETDRRYKELGVYRVNKKIESVPKWINAQPLQVGDTYAGATIYFNTNLSYKEVNALLSTIPDSEFTSDASHMLALFNMDNPINASDQNILYKALLGLIVTRESGDNNLMSMSIDGDDFRTITDMGWLVTSLLFKSSLDGITQDATITKINYPDIVGQLVGKSATFTKGAAELVTTYSLELVLDAGEIDEFPSKDDLTLFSRNGDNVGKVARYTGYESSTPDPQHPYKAGALYILTED